MYQVIDKQTGNIISNHKTRKSALLKVLKLDNIYGGCRYQIKEWGAKIMNKLITDHEEEMNALQDQNIKFLSEYICFLKVKSIKEALARFEFSQTCTDEEWKNDSFNSLFDEEIPRKNVVDLIDHIKRIIGA